MQCNLRTWASCRGQHMRTQRCNLSGQECVHLPLACGTRNRCAKAHTCTQQHCISNPLCTCMSMSNFMRIYIHTYLHVGEGNGGREGIVMHMLTTLVWCTCGHTPVNNASRLAVRWPARQCSPAGSRTLHARRLGDRSGSRRRPRGHSCAKNWGQHRPNCTKPRHHRHALGCDPGRRGLRSSGPHRRRSCR